MKTYLNLVINGLAVLMLMAFALSAAAGSGLDRAIDFPAMEDFGQQYVEESIAHQSIINGTPTIQGKIQRFSQLENEEERLRASISLAQELNTHIRDLQQAREQSMAMAEKVLREYRSKAKTVKAEAAGVGEELRARQLAQLGQIKRRAVDGVRHSGDLTVGVKQFLKDANGRLSEKKAFIALKPANLAGVITAADVRAFLDNINSNVAWIEHHLFISEGLASMLEAAKAHRATSLVRGTRITQPSFANKAAMSSAFDGISAISGKSPKADEITDEDMFGDTFNK